MIKPAIFETDFTQAMSKIDLIKEQAEAIHIDIADGYLVDGNTFTDITEISKIQATTDIEVHLMVRYPHKYVEMMPNNIQTVISQIETPHIDDFINTASEKGIYSALSLKPETDYEMLIPYLDKLRFVQFMSVEPGGQARTFHSEVLEKIKRFKERFPKIAIQIDGAMYYQRVEDIENNINIEHYVVGSDIFKSSNPIEELKKLEDIIYQ